MSSVGVGRIRTIFFVSAGVIMFGYSCLGVFGLWFFRGRLSSTQDFFLVAQPVLALPIFLTVRWSERLGLGLLWLYLLSSQLAAGTFSSRQFRFASWLGGLSNADKALLASLMLLQVGFFLRHWVKRDRSSNNRG